MSRSGLNMAGWWWQRFILRSIVERILNSSLGSFVTKGLTEYVPPVRTD